MKLIMLAGLLAIAAPAVAQDQTTPPPADPAAAAAPAGDPNTPDPVGGYQPSAPALQGAATPGVAPVFQAAPPPDQAYPPPAPLAKYPVCKKGQYDNCIQRGGK